MGSKTEALRKVSAKNINYQMLNILSEFPPLLKLRLKKRSTNNKRHVLKILIVDTCIIGDFLASLPAINVFLKRNNGVVADIIVSPAVKPLAERIRGINQVFIAKSSYNRDIEKRNAENFNSKARIKDEYDCLIVFRISPDAYKMIKRIHYSDLITSDGHLLKFAGNIIKTSLLKKQVRQCRDISFDIIGIKPPSKIPLAKDIFRFTPQDYNNIRRIPIMRGKTKKIIMHTDSGWRGQLWDNDKWVSLIKKINSMINCRIILIGGNKKEKESFNYIQGKIDFKIYSLIGQVDLKELMLIMMKSNYFIGVDSGPRNLAHMANLRSVSLLAPSIKDFMPQNKKDIVIDKSNPGSLGFVYNERTSSMKKITVEEVYEAYKRLVNI